MIVGGYLALVFILLYKQYIFLYHISLRREKMILFTLFYELEPGIKRIEAEL